VDIDFRRDALRVIPQPDGFHGSLLCRVKGMEKWNYTPILPEISLSSGLSGAVYIEAGVNSDFELLIGET